jgi:hypothetical protein
MLAGARKNLQRIVNCANKRGRTDAPGFRTTLRPSPPLAHSPVGSRLLDPPERARLPVRGYILVLVGGDEPVRKLHRRALPGRRTNRHSVAVRPHRLPPVAGSVGAGRSICPVRAELDDYASAVGELAFPPAEDSRPECLQPGPLVACRCGRRGLRPSEPPREKPAASHQQAESEGQDEPSRQMPPACAAGASRRHWRHHLVWFIVPVPQLLPPNSFRHRCLGARRVIAFAADLGGKRLRAGPEAHEVLRQRPIVTRSVRENDSRPDGTLSIAKPMLSVYAVPTPSPTATKKNAPIPAVRVVVR